jgi:hypothetical protein
MNNAPLVFLFIIFLALIIFSAIGEMLAKEPVVESCPAPCMSVLPEQKVYRGAIIAIPKEDYEKLQAYLTE